DGGVVAEIFGHAADRDRVAARARAVGHRVLNAVGCYSIPMAHMPQLSARFRTASRVCGAVVSAVGGLVFLAWALHDERLNRALAGHFIMQLNTGLAFIVAGAALWLRPRAAATTKCP